MSTIRIVIIIIIFIFMVEMALLVSCVRVVDGGPGSHKPFSVAAYCDPTVAVIIIIIIIIILFFNIYIYYYYHFLFI